MPYTLVSHRCYGNKSYEGRMGVARVTVILNLGVTETIAWSKGEGPEKGKQGGTTSRAEHHKSKDP